jgi:Rad3-related DNA helicase
MTGKRPHQARPSQPLVAAPPPAPPPPAELEATLEPILDGMITAHERLLRAVDRHRDAISRADASAIGEAVDEEADALREIAALETRRAALLGRPGGTHVTIREAAAGFDEPARSKFLEMAERLRSLIGAIRSRQAVVRDATRTLMDHTKGLMAQVGAAISHAGTYGRAGKVQSTGPACAVLDMST